MTTKTKMSNLESYQELSIQITTLEMKIDKVLKLLNKPEVTVEPPKLKLDFRNCDKISPHCIEGKSCECVDKFKQSLQVALLTDEEWSVEFK